MGAVHQAECMRCEFCDGTGIVRNIESQTFQYGSGSESADITVKVPVYYCRDCDLAFSGDEAEEIRHDAVCEHLGRLTPRCIREIREINGLTQAQLAEITGFGVASVKRWETGNIIQNLSADRFLRLLGVSSNIALLRALDRSTTTVRPSFQTDFNSATLQAAKKFHLRSSSGTLN